MSQFEITMVVLTVISALLIPAIILMIRGAVKWTRTEGDVKNLVEIVRNLVEHKEKSDQKLNDSIHDVVEEQGKVHREMYEQMRVDRDATDRRLRFVEEYWMKRGQGSP